MWKRFLKPRALGNVERQRIILHTFKNYWWFLTKTLQNYGKYFLETLTQIYQCYLNYLTTRISNIFLVSSYTYFTFQRLDNDRICVYRSPCDDNK